MTQQTQRTLLLVTDLLRTCYGEVANLLRICYTETDVMDFGLNWSRQSPASDAFWSKRSTLQGGETHTHRPT